MWRSHEDDTGVDAVAGIVASNPAESMDVLLVRCVGICLGHGLITHPGDPYQVCVI